MVYLLFGLLVWILLDRKRWSMAGTTSSLLESLLGFWGLCALGKLPLIVIVFK
jgi:hypothetical protein